MAVALLCLSLAGCKRGGREQEVAYVSAPQAFLRDRVAAVYDKVGTVEKWRSGADTWTTTAAS